MITRRWALSLRKRAFDLIVAGMAIVMTAPVMAVVALLVRWRDGGPVIFSQERRGKDGGPFRLWKIRTMCTAPGRLITAAGDSRVTPTGAYLRRFKLDELPQLINVVRGEMSLVGPRPEVPTYVAKQSALWNSIRDLRPGVTDWASLVLSDEEALLGRAADPEQYYVECLVPLKVALARLYRRRGHLGTDLAILAATGLLPVVRRRVAVELAGGRTVARLYERVLKGESELRGASIGGQSGNGLP